MTVGVDPHTVPDGSEARFYASAEAEQRADRWHLLELLLRAALLFGSALLVFWLAGGKAVVL